MSVNYPARIYVGNIHFRSTPEELTAFFEGLNVQSVDIPTKSVAKHGKQYEKCLGFAFVQFETEQDAQEAVKLFNDKEFKERRVHIKSALPQATEEEKQARIEAFVQKKKDSKKKKKAKARAEASAAADEEKANSDKTSTENGMSTAEKSPLKQAPDGPKSKNTIFIMNLDYRANSKSVNALFKEYDVMWVSVPTRRLPKHMLQKIAENKRPIFNKGYAFVKFKSEEDQLKAIQDFNGKEYNGRVLVVEAAVDRKVSSEKPEESTETPVEDKGR